MKSICTGLRKERKLYDLCLAHSSKSREAADLLRPAIAHLLDGRYDEMAKVTDKVIATARESGKVASEARRGIGVSSLDVIQRHDLLDLLLHLDTLSDRIQAVAYRMEWARGLVVAQDMVPLLKDLVDGFVESCRHVAGALEKVVAYDLRSAVDETEQVRVWEDKVDNVRRKAMLNLISMADRIDISSFWRMEEMITHLEHATDTCEETANVLTLIITSRYI